MWPSGQDKEKRLGWLIEELSFGTVQVSTCQVSQDREGVLVSVSLAHEMLAAAISAPWFVVMTLVWWKSYCYIKMRPPPVNLVVSMFFSWYLDKGWPFLFSDPISTFQTPGLLVRRAKAILTPFWKLLGLLPRIPHPSPHFLDFYFFARTVIGKPLMSSLLAILCALSVWNLELSF
jgi:hypothetical protein